MIDQSEAFSSITSGAFEPWKATALSQLRDRLSAPSDFPCVFSQNAFSREKVLFSFVPDLTSGGFEIATEDLRAYVRLSRAWDGSVANAEPLLMVFCPQTVRGETIEDFHRIGWQILQRWHDVDPSPWPEGVSMDPNSPFWSMCFDGMQLFVNMSNPCHHVRRSRNLGDAFTFVINPRERFDIVAGDNEHGRRVRTHIRHRVEKYDGIPHALQLGSYEAGELEWCQYGIVEDNRERLDRCPFEQRVTVRELATRSGVHRP